MRVIIEEDQLIDSYLLLRKFEEMLKCIERQNEKIVEGN